MDLFLLSMPCSPQCFKKAQNHPTVFLNACLYLQSGREGVRSVVGIWSNKHSCQLEHYEMSKRNWGMYAFVWQGRVFLFDLTYSYAFRQGAQVSYLFPVLSCALNTILWREYVPLTEDTRIHGLRVSMFSNCDTWSESTKYLMLCVSTGSIIFMSTWLSWLECEYPHSMESMSL